MTASVTFNPYLQSSGNAGLFNAQSNGVRQGTAFPDPSTRYRLRGGILASTETLPMWGGVGVFANVPGGAYPPSQGNAAASNPSYALGPSVGRALALTGSSKLAGFSVFDEAYGMITSPQSPVPLAGSGMQVNYYPLGSLARINVACDPSLISLRGGTTFQPAVAWDFTNQLLIPELGTLTIAATGSSYNSTTGIVTLNMSVAPAFSVGDSITVASATGTGADLALVNTTATVLTVVGNLITYAIATGKTITTITGGNVTVGGTASQALPVNVLDINSTNSETVVYNATTGFATWNYNGSCATIQI